ncbi:MAG: tRNA (adenine-N(6)-)-methyltransferase, partial [Flavobacteriales bacterium]
MSDIFKFKQFSINQQNAHFKIGTDGVLLGCWAAKNTNKVNTILDIGTGTGVIALIMA